MLLVLWEKDRQPVNDIAKRLHLETNTVTPLLQRMERQGLVTRVKGEVDTRQLEFPFYDDPKQQIETDYNEGAIKELSELAAAFSDDYPTQKLIQKWIDGEVEHMAWEKQYLNYIDKLGYENFLIEMM